MGRFGVFLVLSLFAAVVQARGVPFIDEEFKHYDEQGDKEVADCDRYKNVIDRLSCKKDAIEHRYHESAVPARVDWDYCEYKYKQLSEDELKKLHLKLKTQQTTARGNSDIPGQPLPGEVTKEDFQTEIVCVETYLSQQRDRRNARAWDRIRDGARFGK